MPPMTKQQRPNTSRKVTRYIRVFGRPKITWIPGIVQSLTDPLSYLIELQDGRVVRRHVDHIRARHACGEEAVPEEFEPVLHDLGEQRKTTTEDPPLESPK